MCKECKPSEIVERQHSKHYDFLYGFLYPAFLGVYLFGFLDKFPPQSCHEFFKAFLPLYYFSTQFVEQQSPKLKHVRVSEILRQYFELGLIFQILVSIKVIDPLIDMNSIGLKLPIPNESFAYYFPLFIVLILPILSRYIWKGWQDRVASTYNIDINSNCKTVLSLICAAFVFISMWTASKFIHNATLIVFGAALFIYTFILIFPDKNVCGDT